MNITATWAAVGATAFAVFGTVAAPAHAIDLTTTLVHRWLLDESTIDSVAVDAVGELDGTPDGDETSPSPSAIVAPLAPESVYSLEFNGGNWVEIDQPITESFTICAWVNTESTGDSDHYLSAPIIDSEMGGWDYDYGFGIGTDGVLIYGSGGLDASDEVTDGSVLGRTFVADGEWHSTCVTRDNETGRATLYVDGFEDGSAILGTGLLDSNPNARIGSGYDGNAPFTGLIDDLRIYDTVLTENEVQYVANGDVEVEDSLASTGTDVNSALLPALGLVAAGIIVARRRRRTA